MVNTLGPGSVAEDASVDKDVTPTYQFPIPRLIALHG